MVQEKDAALKRVQARKDYAERSRRDLEERTVRFRWLVVEKTPRQSGFGYYDTDTPEKNVIVSPEFDNEAAAVAWMDAHEPDPGKTLYIKRQRLLKTITYNWIG